MSETTPEEVRAGQQFQQGHVSVRRRRQENVEPPNLENFLAELYRRLSVLDPSVGYGSRQVKKVGLSECLANSVLNVPWQPWRVAQTLIQLGYEPVPPRRRFSFMFQSYMYYYPGVFGYCRALYRQNGLGALFIGTRQVFLLNFVSFSATAVIRPFVSSRINKLLVPFWEQGDVVDSDPQSSISTILIRGSRMFLASMITTLAVELLVHPLKVIAVRCVSQYVGGENTYDYIFPSLRHIYRTEGLPGLYSGLAPALLGTVCNITIHSTLWLLFEIITANISSQVGQIMVRLLSVPLLTLLPQSYAYPFFNVATHMMVNNVDLKAGSPPFATVHQGWVNCFRHLKSTNRLHWGSSILASRFVYVKPPGT